MGIASFMANYKRAREGRDVWRHSRIDDGR